MIQGEIIVDSYHGKTADLLFGHTVQVNDQNQFIFSDGTVGNVISPFESNCRPMANP
jgi:hypothetical protein